MSNVIRYPIEQNSVDSHQASPGWCVAFVRYEQPCSAYASTKTSGSTTPLSKTKPLLIVQNDAVAVNVTNSKSSFAKMCSIQMKTGDVFYQNAVSPGDWVMVWINDSQAKIDEIVVALRKGGFDKQKEGGSVYSNWQSGLKFVGKVISVGTSDSVSPSGARSTTTQIDCQAFLEMASSVYFTNTAKIQNQARQLSGDVNFFLNSERFKNVESFLRDRLLAKATDLKNPSSPDVMIMYLMILLMGMKLDQFTLNDLVGGYAYGNYNDAIEIPNTIASVFNRPKAKYLHQFYRVLAGVQTYAPTGKSPHVDFYPLFKGDKRSKVAADIKGAENAVFKFTEDRCKGWCGFKSFSWSNVSYWQAFQEFLHPQLNEMYTALKCDETGTIRPHVVIREMPFGTGLFNSLRTNIQSKIETDTEIKSVKYTVKKGDTLTKIAKKNGTSVDKLVELNKSQIKNKNKIYPGQIFKIKDIGPNPKKIPRGMYHNLPRWFIDETMLLSIDVATDENRRINFCQVWGKNSALDYASGASGATLNAHDFFLDSQLVMGNFVADFNDVKRAGLRADIVDTNFDHPTDRNLSNAPLWARMRADWLFNGHLKLAGSVSLIGITEPICEGDNVEVRGTVYHIESVSHSASISSDGRKSFRTTLGISNGILSSSLEFEGVPSYACHRGKDAESPDNHMPGLTDYEDVEGRDPNGDRKTKVK